jgi:hypothetical protein
MRNWLLRVLIVGVGMALLFGPALPAGAQQPAPRGERPPADRDQPSGRDQGQRVPPDQQAAGLLRQSYDSLGLVRIWLSSDRVKIPDDQAKLAEQAEEFYRGAHRAYKDRDYGRAINLSVAALDGSGGLLSALHASTKPPDGLPPPPDIPIPPSRGADTGTARGAAGSDQPAPPARPQDAAVEVLRSARQQIVAADKGDAGKGPAGRFLDASRAAYEQGRQAYEKGDYDRALDLGAAAEAWSRVGEDLRRAENPDQPGDRRPRGEPLPERLPERRPPDR